MGITSLCTRGLVRYFMVNIGNGIFSLLKHIWSLYIIYMGRELTSVNATTTAEVNTLIAAAGHQSSAQVTTIAQDEAAALAIALGE